MAVYTEVPDDELAHSWPATAWVRFVLQGHRRGRGEHQLSHPYREGAVFPHALREAGRSADLPFFLGLMEHLAKAGINCPTPVHDTEGRVLRTLASRPAAIITFLEGVWIRRPQPRHCGPVGKARPGCTWPAAASS